MNNCTKICAFVLLTFLSLQTEVQSGSQGQGCYLDFKSKSAKQEFNRHVVIELMTLALIKFNFTEAAQLLSPNYIQHSPFLGDGREPFIEFGATFVVNQNGSSTTEIKRTAADGDYVWVHSKATQGEVSLAICDIFRLDCGTVAEHWDVVQAIGNGPFANSHPFF